jgi:Asp-tRNA(Asn)/Glu-tRNA(Gln) amidotransferase A subunit family amidase
VLRRDGVVGRLVALAAAVVLAVAAPAVHPAAAQQRSVAPGSAATAPAWSPFESSIAELQAALASGRITSVALVDYYLARIETLDRGASGLRAIAAVSEAARTTAAGLDVERRERGPRGPLHGIPLAINDNLQTIDLPTTAGSQLLADFMASEDAAVVARLRQAGAIVLAKGNVHEFGYGITNVGSGFGRTRNPYDPTRNAGGANGGVAVAVSANLAAAGIGSDTCGSLRVPAAHNSLVALRATQGLVSRRGMVPLSRTQDMPGPLARSVTDAALLMQVLAGVDPLDPQTAESYGLKGARIGILEDLLLVEPADAAVAEVVGRAAERLQSLGAAIQRVALPEYWEITGARLDGLFVLVYEFKRDIDRYFATTPGIPVHSLADLLASGRYHPEIEPSLRASEAMGERARRTYLEALLDRQRLRERVLALMARERLDALVYPTIRRVAARHERPQPGSNCALSANTGLPALTVPAGFTAAGMPVGIELLGAPWSEARLLSLGYAFEQAGRHRVPPPLPGEAALAPGATSGEARIR